MKSSLSTTDVQICVKYIELFHAFGSVPLDCHALASKGFMWAVARTCHTEHLEVKQHPWRFFPALGCTGCTFEWQAPPMGWQPPATKGTSLTWRKLVLPLENPWFRYFRFIRHCIFCHLMLHNITRCSHDFSSHVLSSMRLKNQIHHGWYFTFSIATIQSVILGDNNSTEESSQFFWHRKSYPHVALQCRRQWENISKSLSNISFCRVPKSVSSYAVCS